MESRRLDLAFAILLFSQCALAASKIDLYKARIESLIDREESKIRDEKKRKASVEELKKERAQYEKKIEINREKFVKTKPKQMNKEDSPEYAHYERQLAIEQQKRLDNEKKFAGEQKRLQQYQKQVEAWVDPIEYDVKPKKRKTRSADSSSDDVPTIHYDSGVDGSGSEGF